VRVAVLDLGTNSTRLLVAAIEDGELHELVRRSTVTRLGEGVDAGATLAPAAIERVLEAVGRYRRDIDRLGAERVVAVATSAVRDSGNGDELRRGLLDRHGIEARTISGEEEARLTFSGATAGRPERDEDVLVIDIGGGSTELVTGRPGGEPAFHVSTALGSVRHSERHLEHDPPTSAELEALMSDARRIIEDEVPVQVRRGARAGIAVSGTPTQLASIDLEARGSSSSAHGHRLELEAVRGLLERLADAPLAERREIPGLDPDRAPTIVAGAAILVEAMEAFGLASIEVSEADILHGAALDAWVQKP
jgi:exopolyphosphatase/guanosine-5'-triphosphate,3'-diphosphate pyrophosphatase